MNVEATVPQTYAHGCTKFDFIRRNFYDFKGANFGPFKSLDPNSGRSETKACDEGVYLKDMSIENHHNVVCRNLPLHVAGMLLPEIFISVTH
jgi:hypothetical protein